MKQNHKKKMQSHFKYKVNKAKLSASKNLKIHRLIGVLLGKITPLRENHLIWRGLGVKVCHAYSTVWLTWCLFTAQFFAVVADEFSNYQMKDHKIMCVPDEMPMSPSKIQSKHERHIQVKHQLPGN